MCVTNVCVACAVESVNDVIVRLNKKREDCLYLLLENELTEGLGLARMTTYALLLPNAMKPGVS